MMLMFSEMKQDKAAQEAIIAGFNNLRQVGSLACLVLGLPDLHLPL